MSDALLALVFLIAGIGVVIPWMMADLHMKLDRRFGYPTPARMRRRHRILGRLYLPALAVMSGIPVFAWHQGGQLETWLVPGGFALLWVFRERDDDDDFKRWLQRAAGRVKSLGHRLTVVPAGAA